MLRNYGMQGVFEKASAILFGRARDYSELEKKELEKSIIQVIKGEFKNDKIIVITNMDFGHTDPQFILPLGINAEIDPVNKTFKLLESQFK
jgi:muramoyltetrapeptide carboxypeptidase LdcA involved in peptidoglycan recycling